MRKIFITIIALVVYFSNFAQEKENTKNITTYYLIRHAEKDTSDKTNRNPSLTNLGIKRANNWARILINVDFHAVYSTNYIRTKVTAKPTADKHNLETILYNVREFEIGRASCRERV